MNFFKMNEEEMSEKKIETLEEFKASLTKEQKSFFLKEIKQLLNEADGKEDAKNYLGDVASDAIEKWSDLDEHWELMRTYLIEELKAYKI